MSFPIFKAYLERRLPNLIHCYDEAGTQLLLARNQKTRRAGFHGTPPPLSFQSTRLIKLFHERPNHVFTISLFSLPIPYPWLVLVTFPTFVKDLL